MRRGDPIITTFDNRTFEFTGKVGAFYNIISEKHHQVRQLPAEGLGFQSLADLPPCHGQDAAVTSFLFLLFGLL
jgi:hypothetical protein